MKPDNAEYWWYEIKPNSRYGQFEIADLVGFTEKSLKKEIIRIESDPLFVRWIGVAHPPKSLKRGIMEHGVFREKVNGICVMYDEVKDFDVDICGIIDEWLSGKDC